MSETMRLRYLADAVSTATPAQRIVMLYDRLHMDIERALVGFETGERVDASAQLRHAQQIVSELWGSLDVDAWSGGPDLAALYGFLLNELMEADRSGDADRLSRSRRIVDSLRSSWLQAAGLLATEPAPARPRDTAVAAAAASAASASATAAAARRPVSAGSWIS